MLSRLKDDPVQVSSVPSPAAYSHLLRITPPYCMLWRVLLGIHSLEPVAHDAVLEEVLGIGEGLRAPGSVQYHCDAWFPALRPWPILLTDLIDVVRLYHCDRAHCDRAHRDS